MFTVMANEAIQSLLEHGETCVKANGWAGVAADLVTPQGAFEGTIVYFPGVTIDELGDVHEVNLGRFDVIEGVLE